MKKTAKRTKKSKSKREIILPKSPKKLSKQKLDNMGFFQRIRYKYRMACDRQARKRAESLATLPKDPVKRFFAHFQPKRVFNYWFSWYGLAKILKFFAACFLLGIIFIGILFLYFKNEIRDLESQLSHLSIQDTVNTYLDRNGVVLWKDTGEENYRIAVDGTEISDYMRQATVAIEDKNFYEHPGFDLTALMRATLANLSGQKIQGASTLTQQLIKQVYFSEEAQSAGRGGIPRKIKEVILSIELEKTYSKDQILTMYLNESPYGGRRNGVESAARTYFDKSAKDLTLAESALLAAIPNNPAVFNPYNSYGHEKLLARQHSTLDAMVKQGYISSEEAEEAKKVPVLDQIKPESSQYSNMLAPHFVLEVRSQLEKKYGYATMRSGGFTIKTTLDYRVQKIAEDAVAIGASHAYKNKSDNLALVSVDVETSQIAAMVGSVNFFNGTYGEFNATTDALIEPGSTIKPILDYAPLFTEREGQNFGPGSILKDENIDHIYCAGSSGPCRLTNAIGRFSGDVTIRKALGQSLNIPAVKALYINGIDNSLQIAHELGDVSYCNGRENYGLSIAIGSGCNVRMVEHANAYASLARGGSFKELSYVLEVKNSAGDVLETWTDSSGKRVVDEQVAYMISDILSDRSARFFNSPGFVINGVWTATKTGTTTTTSSSVTKDSLMVSYSTALSTFVWNGNHDGSGLASNNRDVSRNALNHFMERVHKDIYEPEGKWHPGDKPIRPAGIQNLSINGRSDIWPSWFDPKKSSGTTKTSLNFNKFTYLLASDCTPSSHIISVEVSKSIDPMTKKEIWDVPEPYNREEQDACPYNYSYLEPTISSISIADSVATFIIIQGSETLKTYEVFINGVTKGAQALSAGGTFSVPLSSTDTYIKVVVTDVYDGTASSEREIPPSSP